MGINNLENRYGAELPGEYFSNREINPNLKLQEQSVHDFWDLMMEEQSFAKLDAESASSLRTHTTPKPLVFRGQSNHGHGLSASLHRFAQSESTKILTESALGRMEKAILEEAQKHGLRKEVSPGEILMILQHHAAPTRLLDVSVKPLEALYFAVEDNDAIDGRLFLIWLRSKEQVKLSDRNDLPWSGDVRGESSATAKWSRSLLMVEDRPLDARMIAQRGRFLVGGLHRTYMGLNMWHDKQLRASERQQISMFLINFPKINLNQFESRKIKHSIERWPAIAWTIRIPAAWKATLRELLANEGISYESMYPDLANIQWKTKSALRDFLSS